VINTTHAQDDRELIQYLNAGRNHAKTIATIKIKFYAHRSDLHRQRSQPQRETRWQSSRQAIAPTELTENAVRKQFVEAWLK